jgi:predicted kinase
MLEGNGEVLDYAVKMINLPQDRMLDFLLNRNRASPEMLARIARKLADFHSRAETSPAINAFGVVEAIQINTDENFVQTEKYVGRTITAREFQAIQGYTNTFLQTQAALFDQRVSGGRIRDCHGDLHSRNICVTDGICIYDCIEFNARMRYGDTASDIAFLAMDLDHRARSLLKFYECYRAYVRGKVESFKIDDSYISEMERKQTAESARSYFDLAYAYTRARPYLFITVGLIGSGKSTLARSIARRLGLTILSSDIVRKQMAGIPVSERRFEPVGQGIYSDDSSRRTYDKLLSDARGILEQGDSVIIDASFTKADERRKARKLADETGVDFFILETSLNEAETRRRLAQRLSHASVSDGRWELYEPQKSKFEPVTEKHFTIDSAQPLEVQITRVIEKI